MPDDIKLRIECDGTTTGTRVTDAVTGRRIEGVQKVVFTIDAQKLLPIVELTLYPSFVDLVGVAQVVPAIYDACEELEKHKKG